MKRFFALFMVVIMSVFLLVGCGTTAQDAEAIAGLQATVDDLQNQVEGYSALKTELDSANDKIAELQSELDALKTEKEGMSAKLEMLYKIEPLEETMYIISEAKIYGDLYGEVLGEEPAGTIPAKQELKITGKSAVTGWYEIEMDGKKQYVSGSLVSRDKSTTTTTTKSTETTKSTTTTTTEEVYTGDEGYDENALSFDDPNGLFTSLGIPEAGDYVEGAGHAWDVQ